MMIAFGLALVVTVASHAQLPVAGDGEAARIARDAQHAIETGTDVSYERPWRARIARNPRDARALLAVATLERLRYRYERADSLYARLLRLEPRPSQYSANANLGMGTWRALGSDAARADSFFAHARADASASGDRATESLALIGLAQVRSRRSGPRAGLQLTRESLAALDQATPEDSAQLLCLEGTFMEQLGDSTGPLRVIRGRDMAKRAKALRVWAACDVFIAQSVERSGFFETAAANAAEAITLFERVHYLPGAAVASQWLGYVRSVRGYFSEARADLNRAIHAAEVTHYGSVEAWARIDLADIYLALGDHQVARDLARRSAVLHQQYGDLWGLAVDRRFEGLALQAQGLIDEACARLSDAVAAYQRAGLSFNAVEPLRLLALANIRAGRLDSAERTLDAATRLARASANSGWFSELPVHLARIAMLRGDLRRADSLIVAVRSDFRWRADSVDLDNIAFASLEAQLALRQQRLAVAESAVTFVSSAIAKWRRGIAEKDLRAGLAQLHDQWGPLSDSYPDIVARLAAAGHLSTAFRFVESIRAREIAEGTLRTIAGMADTARAVGEMRRVSSAPLTVSVEEVQRRLSRDAAFVELTLGLGRAPTTAIVITRDTTIALSLPARETLVPLIDRYLRIASAGTEPVALGRQLGAALLQPLARALPARITHLEISPDGDLFRVPFDALRLAGDRFAVERFATSIVPSATVDAMLEGIRPKTASVRFVAIGDPDFRRDRAAAARGADADDAGLFSTVSLARLPRSADEARRVAEYGIEPVVWTRDEASETAVRRADWSHVAVVHFATHALIDGEGQTRTALALSPGAHDDGFLTTSEIASLRFNGALIVLSACQSLGGQILGGEGLRGLAGPLFEAGARTIVVTHWSIGDRSVAPFVDRFYAAMARGASVGDALRQTKLAAIHDGARIADWGAFTVIGDASMHPRLRPRRLSPFEWLHDLIQPARDTSGAR